MKTIVLWLLVVAALSLMPGRNTPSAPMLDKFLHLVLYAVTSLLFCVTYEKKKISANGLMTLSALAAISYGALMEVLQLYVETRGFSWGDIIANTLGAVVGIVLFYNKNSGKTSN